MIKSTITEAEFKEANEKYPCLMKSKLNNTVVLFIKENYGAVVYWGDATVDHAFHDRDEENYEPFDGTITLSNAD